MNTSGTISGTVAALDLVRVWLVRDDLPDSAMRDLAAVLDPEEQRRADAFLRPADRRRFIIAHGAARFIVAGQLGAPARELRWTHGPHGKPELAGTWTGVQANLSHSGGLSMIAVTASRRVGADIQRLTPGRELAAMAQRYFPPEEARFVRSARGTQSQAGRFAQLWARKEALVKAAGGRLMQGLPVSVQSPGGIVADYPGEAPLSSYRIVDIPAPSGFRAAIALSGDEQYEVTQTWWESHQSG